MYSISFVLWKNGSLRARYCCDVVIYDKGIFDPELLDLSFFCVFVLVSLDVLMGNIS